MNSTYLKSIYLLPVYVLIQILILNQILFFSYINPFLYILPIICLPLKTAKWYLLIYAFIIGLIIDLFSHSLGFHSTACVLFAFFKPLVSKITIPHNILADTDEISLTKIGFKSNVIFTSILILIHHSCLFILEHLTFNIALVAKISISSLITLIIILITQLLSSKKNK
tara:strand:- start:137 stop:643 length:507 start_codon:yes stop_codon:yes gene_type:complete